MFAYIISSAPHELMANARINGVTPISRKIAAIPRLKIAPLVNVLFKVLIINKKSFDLKPAVFD